MGKSAAANWANRWARGGRPDPLIGTSVPNRAEHPKRKVALKNLVATANTGRMTGEASIHVVDITDPNDRGKYYSGYTKTEAKRRHKEHLEGM